MKPARPARALVVLVAGALAAACGRGAAAPSTQTFDLGDPSPEEQEIWYLVNRARADPAAEGRRLAASTDPLVAGGIEAFGVDVDVLVADFDGYPAQPPVAWDPRLAVAAERHATDQATTRTQGHPGSDGSRPAQRIRDAGVDASFVVENVGSYVHSAAFGHAAFLIDWGGDPPSGVQDWPTPGHRFAIMSARTDAPPANVVGLSYVPAEPGDDGFGPNVLVQEFARIDATFIVGSVWRDADGDGVFDHGEGVGDARVVPERGDWHAVTLSEGGFVLPVDPGEGVTLTVSATGFEPVVLDVAVGDENVLVDVELVD